MNVAFGFTKSSLKRWTFFKSWEFFEFFENYIKDFPKIDQNTILKKTEIILEIYYVFFSGYIAESNWRGNGKTLTFLWKKNHRKTRKKIFFLRSKTT